MCRRGFKKQGGGQLREQPLTENGGLLERPLTEKKQGDFLTKNNRYIYFQKVGSSVVGPKTLIKKHVFLKKGVLL